MNGKFCRHCNTKKKRQQHGEPALTRYGVLCQYHYFLDARQNNNIHDIGQYWEQLIEGGASGVYRTLQPKQERFYNVK
jgi:predicted transposase YbfD/YdcC